MLTELSTTDYAPDGSPVPLYHRLPPRTSDAVLIHRLLPSRSSVLDLGCGTGRLAEPLTELGHPVTGVDNEPRMLAALRHATGVLNDLTRVDLDTEFGAVLLMSHLVNAADPRFATAALRSARRHLDDGIVLVERYPPGWVHGPEELVRDSDGIRYILRRHEYDTDGVRAATIAYEFDGVRAQQQFTARDLDDRALGSLASAAHLRVDSPLDPDGRLVLLRPAG